ncbi:hypothetical protein GA0074692_6265 [Micromonospora pallida]|uniref:Thrombospondin n=1 Tax=Micromonospora pallida TaxID=145854 RepID=A0A1C6THX1_9ACTN|nr:DUF4190 domain-containing protein [Micromonospora pallida]SCL41336.1 hypothetical protein GA0074692_6265 [Micromonospora pallida]
MKIPSLSRHSEPAARDGDEAAPGAADRGSSTMLDTGDGRVAAPVVTDRGEDRTTYRSAAATVDGRDQRTGPASTDGRHRDPRDAEAERQAEARAAAARAATARPAEADRIADREPTGPGLDPATGTPDRTVDLDEQTRKRILHRARPDIDRDASHPDLDRDVADPTRDDDRVPEPATVAAKKPRASLLATLGLIVGVAGLFCVLTGALAGYGIAVGAIGAVLSVLGLVATRRRHVAGKTDALLGIVAGLAAVVLGVLAMTGQYDWPTADGDWINRFREWLDSQFANRL